MTTSLVIQTSFLGDMVLTTPLLAYLAEQGPVDVVGTPAAIALLANHPAVRTPIAYDKRSRDSGLLGLMRMARRLRAAKYDRVYLAQGSRRSGALAFAARIGQRTGFESSAGRRFYTTRVPYIENDHHAARLLSLAVRPGPQMASDKLRPSLYPGDDERAAVDALLAGVDRSRPMYALAPGSVWATKRWPRYAELAKQLGAQGTVVAIGSPADVELTAAIVKAAGPSGVDAAGKLSLLASAELIRRSAVLVTNDSAPQHLGSAMNTPTVSIFGPTVPGFGFGPLAEKSAVVGVDSLACRPCDRHGPARCPLGHWKCMAIESLEVARIAERLIR